VSASLSFAKEFLMSDQAWSKEALMPPLVRQQVEEQIKLERPPGLEAARVAALPAPTELRAVLDNPQSAEELWKQVDATVERPDDSLAVVQMGMALYFLHGLHFQGKPGYEHLERKRPEADPV
jgi:hypothetical protein